MRSHRFTVVLPESKTGERYVDVPATGTGLDGVALDAPQALTMTADLGAAYSGDAIVTVRASATDLLRFRVRGLSSAKTEDIIVTELL